LAANTQETISSMLAGGDRRSLGRAAEVVELIRRAPRKISNLVECLWDSDARVRMRAADALEKIARDRAVLLQPFKTPLLGLLAEATQPEVRWHLALIVPRLRLNPAECRAAAEILETYLAGRGAIVKTLAMQGLADLLPQDPSLRPMVLDLIRSHTRTGTPAMRARGRILLGRLE
jgi:hypothetical protein